MRVLVANHTSTVSGAEHALLDLLAAAPGGIELVVACPDGELASRLAALGHRRVALTGTAGSLKLGVRRTPAAVAQLARAAAELRRLGRALAADVVHANSTRSALSAVAARDLGGPPVLAHVHDALVGGAVVSAVRRVVRRADVVVVNSEFTARSVGGPCTVTYNPVDLARFDPGRVDAAAARAELDVPAGAPVLAVVGQITPWKGQATAIEALSAVRREVPGARLLVAGSPKFVDPSTRYDNRTYLASLHDAVARLGLGDAVTFLGEREDVPAVVAAADVVLVPSHAEPFGRIVVEALAMRRPVVATAVGGPAEILRGSEAGVLVDPHDVGAWAACAARLLADPDRRARMGRAGREVAARFDRATFARAMGAAYGETARA